MILKFQGKSTSLGILSLIKYLLLSSLCMYYGCQENSDFNSKGKDQKLIPSVEAVQAGFGTLPLTERLTGVVKAKNQVEIYPEISAAIVEIFVENGAFVKKGQPLIQLRDREFQERLKQAKANYQIAIAQAKQAEARLQEMRAELNRTQSLAEKKLTSEAELETARTQTISAEASLELAHARIEQASSAVEESQSELDETIIRAPVSGSIGDRNAEVGMLVSPNTRLFTLGKLDDLKIEIILTDRMLNYIEVGQKTEIFADYLSANAMEAPLKRISPFLHPVTHSTVAEIDMKNPESNLKPGMFVTVDIYYGESEQATLVPMSAIYENPASGATGVFVSRDSQIREPVGSSNPDKAIALTPPVPFKFVPVDVLAKGRMHAGIKGVNPDEWVVTLGQNLLGSDSSAARVHPVQWNWVEQLQNMQSQDLLKDIMDMQQGKGSDNPGTKTK